MKYNPFPNKKYKIIYADPAWQFKTWSDKGKGRSAERHYRTMPLEEIKKLPVARLADEDCALFLWATSPMLQNAFHVIAAWGFEYKTIAIGWMKLNKNGSLFKGLGFYTRSNCELCLLATKGNPIVIGQSFGDTFCSIRREHSRKPDEVRERIVELMGDCPRIELFARERFPGWDAWGDQVDSHIFQKTTHISATKKPSNCNIRKKMRVKRR